MNDQTDLLISRVVDGAASSADWAELERAAGAQPGLWRDVALAQRDQALLTLAVGEAIDAAGNVDLPLLHAAHSLHPNSRLRRFGVWGGWAAAAAVTLAYVGVGTHKALPGDSQQASVVPDLSSLKKVLSPDQAWEVYEAVGKREQSMLGEMPERVLIEATPAQDGQSTKLVFIRQIIEVRTINNLMKATIDETGAPVIVPVKPETLPSNQGQPIQPTRRRLPAVQAWPRSAPWYFENSPAGTVPALTETMS